MIRFVNVFKRYKGGLEALCNVNCELEKGRMTFITGHSGAGKSTFLKLIPLIEKTTRGEIVFDGQNLSRLRPREIPYLRRKIGIVFQDNNLLEDRSIFHNVALPLIIAGNHPSEVGGRVRAALDKVGLLSKEKLFPLALSGGEQQRVGIARAVVNRPSLLVADEPTGNLDPELSQEIMQLFEQFTHIGTTVIVATHDHNLIARSDHRLLALRAGEIIADGRARDLI